MLPGEFIFNNVHSSELANSKIQLRPEISAPKRKSTFISIPGVSGDYILDENAYENTFVTLEVICQVEDKNEVMPMREKIVHTFDSGGYMPLELYFDPDRVYYGKVTDGPTFRVSGQWPTILLYSLNLNLKPFKEHKTNNSPITSDGQPIVIVNPSSYVSPSIITMRGVGNFSLTINDILYSFNDVDGSIVINSVIQEAYKIVGDGIVGRNNKMFTRHFPLLVSGPNTISFTGATSITVEGRWRTLVS